MLRKPARGVIEIHWETDMRTIVLALSLIALAAPSYTQVRDGEPMTMEKRRHMVGKETSEGEGAVASAACRRSVLASV